jgi:arylsulfatase A-like enzyme
MSTPASPQPPLDRTILPIPDRPFRGIAGRTLADSRPEFPEPVSAPEGAPSILLVLLDDAGFGNPMTFGGPVQTPALQRVADDGLRYNRFHVTALCSPTRAALLSGRNHHNVGFGQIGEFAGGWPGYNANWPKSAACIAETLRRNGYNTAAFGKWHLSPDDQQGTAGPFNRWPNGLGFDYFWGFLGGEAGQYDPLIVENNTVLGVPHEKDYYFPDAMGDKAVQWIREQQSQAPGKPFFVYFSTGATHAPHHVSAAWADKYKGQFDDGWDKLRERTFARQKDLGIIPADAKLTPRPDAMPAWESLGKEERTLYARQMEVYAGFQENADYNVGRVLDAIDEVGMHENTLVIYIFGDNGASMEGATTGTFNELTMQNGIPLDAQQQLALIERYGGLQAWGGPSMAPHYAATWAWAGNAPFRWGKQVAAYLGGTRNPVVVSWPRRIKGRGGLRSQFSHVIDVAPTILEAAGLPAPVEVNGIKQMPFDGVSFAYTFEDGTAAERHTQQYFEIMGYRAMYKDGWWAGCFIDRIPWDATPQALARLAPGVYDPDKDRWELFDLRNDFSQADDVAAKFPEKLKELQDLFWQEAEKYHVLPLLGGLAAFFGVLPERIEQRTFTYYSGVQNVAPGMIPHVYGKSYAIDAYLTVPESGVEGVIVAEADFLGGFALYVDGGLLHHTYSFMGVKVDTLSSSIVLPTGEVRARFEFLADARKRGTGGRTRLLINDIPAAEGRLEHTVPTRFSGYAGMDIGCDNGLPVSHTYADRSPFRFTGTIKKVVFDLEPTPLSPTDKLEDEAEKHQTRTLAGING